MGDEVNYVKEAPLMLKVLRELDSMGDNRPKTWPKLVRVLTKSHPKLRVVSCSDPMDILTACNLLYDQKATVAAFDRIPLSVDIKSVDAKAWIIGKSRALQSNSTMLYAATGSKQAEEIEKVVKDSLTDLRTVVLCPSKEAAVAILTKGMFVQKILTSEEIKDVIISNLVLAGYIELEETDQKVVVKYNLPSDFMMLCMKRLQNDYYDMYGRRMCEGQATSNQMPILIARVNRHLKFLKNSIIAADTVQKQAHREAIQVLVKSRKKSPNRTYYEDELVEYDSDIAEEWRNEQKERSRRSPSPRCRRKFRRRRSSSPRPRVKHPRRESCDSRSESSDSSDSRSRTPSPTRRYSTRRQRSHSPSSDQFHSPQDGPAGFDFFNQLCQDMSKLKVEDIKMLHKDLLPESIAAILLLEKMGPYKPKTLTALCNAVKPSCRFLYVTSLNAILEEKPTSINPEGKSQKRKSDKASAGKRQLGPTSKMLKIGTMSKERIITLTPRKIFRKDADKSVPKKRKGGAAKPDARMLRSGGRAGLRGARGSRFSRAGRGSYHVSHFAPRHTISPTQNRQPTPFQTELTSTRTEAQHFYKQLSQYIKYLTAQYSTCMILADQGKTKVEHFENMKSWLQAVGKGDRSSSSPTKKGKNRVEEPMELSKPQSQIPTDADLEAMETDPLKTTREAKPTTKDIYEGLIQCCVTLTEVEPSMILDLLEPMVEVKEDGSIKYDITPQDLKNVETLAERTEASIEFDHQRMKYKCMLIEPRLTLENTENTGQAYPRY